MKEYKWCAIDAEGDVGNRGLLGVAFYSDMMQEYITDRDDIITALYGHANEGYTFLAHNAEYDSSVIFWQLDLRLMLRYYNGRFNRGEWKYRNHVPHCEIWDTLSLSGGLSLEKLGKALHLHKYPTPQKLLGNDPDRYEWKCEKHDIWECEECYAVRDAEIVYHFMAELEKTLDAWGIAPQRRINGLSVAAWRSFDNPDPIGIDDFQSRKLARKSFHGGRVETFKLGHISPLFTADVCSMYPSVMLDNMYPDPQSLTYFKNPHISMFDLTYHGVADIEITIPYMYIPPLPYIHKGLLQYPVGRIRGTWTMPEIRYAVGLGAEVHRVYAMSVTRQALSPFHNFITAMWNLRSEYEQSNDPRSLFAKLLMNNLYGRLGASEAMDEKLIYTPNPGTNIKKQPKTSWYDQDHKLYLVFEQEKRFGNKWNNVMWAAYVTAYARIKLHQYLQLQGTSAVYCDTDSVFSTAPINGLGEGLGSLRDPATYMEAIIAAPKLYALRDLNGEWRAKAKGVRKSAALEFLRTGEASYDQPIKPLSQGVRKIKAGTWIQVTKRKHNVPHRRSPIHPELLATDDGSSDTVPPCAPFR